MYVYVCIYIYIYIYIYYIYIYVIIIYYLWQRRREWGNPWRILFLDKERSAPFPVALQYRVDAWSGRSKPLFRLPVQKIHLIYSPRVEDVSDIKLIRTDFSFEKNLLLLVVHFTVYICFPLHNIFHFLQFTFYHRFFSFSIFFFTFFTVFVFTPFETSFF